MSSIAFPQSFLTSGITLFILDVFQSPRHEENAYMKFLLIALTSYLSILAFAYLLQAISLWINKHFVLATIETFKFLGLLAGLDLAFLVLRPLISSH